MALLLYKEGYPQPSAVAVMVRFGLHVIGHYMTLVEILRNSFRSYYDSVGYYY